ncbi:MAG TPA: clan AA aspartic protease [Pyrinomonadaceae bacterium]|jgi:clan AA aspartic protease|nr:clan AA aspartic protease [Pyrinomonadaceae bacterium]
MTVKPANYNYRRRTNGTSLTGGKGMGYVHAEIQLTNEDDLAFHRRGWAAENEIRRVTTTALVDSGAFDLIINKEVQEQLQLPVLGKRPVRLADESIVEVDIVGPVEVRFETRTTTVRALVMPDTEEVLLGAIPLEGLDVIIDPLRERLLVNPPETTNAKIKRVA